MRAHHAIRGLAIVAVLVLSAPSFSVASGLPRLHDELFTPQDVTKLRTVEEAAISPDGRLVAYVLSVPRQPLKGEEDGPSWAELHVVNSEGKSRALLTGHLTVSEVAWTPDGMNISFLLARANEHQKEHIAVYMVSRRGGSMRKIVGHETDIASYSWNSDGSKLAFLAPEAPRSSRTKLEKQGFRQEVYGEEWHPVQVWTASWNGDRVKQRLLPLSGSASELRWSPTGSLLAIALAPTSSQDDRFLHRKVRILNSESGRIVGKLENPGKLGEIAWSPDGEYLAVVSAADANDPLQGRLMVGSVTGGGLREILPGFEGHVTAVAWKDASTINFLADKDVRTIFGEVQKDGSGRKETLSPSGPILTKFSLARKVDTVAFIADTARHPKEVFLLKHGQASPRRLTVSNPWLANIRLSPQQSISFKARDGLPLQGILIPPQDLEEGRRYPLILIVHGGPEGHCADGWLTDYWQVGQVAAARGFAVFYPNYRGSSGRGVAFSKLDQQDTAGKEFDDLVDSVDHLVATGLVDRARVGIAGISYGGYAAAWASTYYSDRFAASVVIAGVGDRFSQAGTSGHPEENFAVHDRLRPWDNWQWFLERSPIYYAKKSRTPTLILEGEGDPVVPGTQGLELYNYLHLVGQAPVRLVVYPGEGHGLVRAASQLDANLRILEWMERYLKGSGGPVPPADLDYRMTGPRHEP